MSAANSVQPGFHVETIVQSSFIVSSFDKEVEPSTYYQTERTTTSYFSFPL